MDYEYIQDSTKTTDISIDDFVRRVSLSVWTNKKKMIKSSKNLKKKELLVGLEKLSKTTADSGGYKQKH